MRIDESRSANAFAGFSSVQIAPIHEGGSASSSDVAVVEPLPNAAEAGRVSQEAVPMEQKQPLRAVEPDEWAMKVRAKPFPKRLHIDNETFTSFTPTAGSLVSSMRVWKRR